MDDILRQRSAYVLGLLLILPVAEAGAATLVPDRATLIDLLGSAAVTEDFEGFVFSEPTLYLGGPGTTIDSSSRPVVEGIALTSIDGSLDTENLDSLGHSKVVRVDSSGPNSLRIDFQHPVTAFGFDHIPAVATGTEVTLTLFSADDQSIVDRLRVHYFSPAKFIGVVEPAGIGRVEIDAVATGPFNIYTNRIDNLSFGIAGSSVAGDFPITTASGFQSAPALAANPDEESFLVVWHDNRTQGRLDIYGQIVGADGRLRGSERLIAQDGSSPHVVFNDREREFLVVYASVFRGVFARRVSVDGSAVGAEIPVFTQHSQNDASVAYDTVTNRYLVAWGQAVGAIRARILAANGSPAGSVFDPSSGVGGQYPQIVFNPGTGRYLIVWQRFLDLFARSLNPDGGFASGTVSVASTAFGPSVALNPATGRSLVVWSRIVGSSFAGVRAALLNGDGSRIGDEREVASAGLNGAVTHVTAGSRYLVVWSADDQRVLSRFVSAAGDLSGSELQVSDSGTSEFATVADQPGASSALVAWSDVRNGLNSNDIFGHIVSTRPNQSPTADAGDDSGVECSSQGGGMVMLDGSRSIDPDSSPGTNDDIVQFEWLENYGLPSQVPLGSGQTLSVTLPLGTHAITLRVVDVGGGEDTDEVFIGVVDTRPPELSAVVTPLLLWPPNHRMVDVRAQAGASDVCSTVVPSLESITSDEPDDAEGTGDGHTLGDIEGAAVGTADFEFQLRAERAGTGDGRTYTVVYRAIDGAGNSVRTTLTVFVPHDMHGVTEPLTIRVGQSETGTLLEWDRVPGALSYDIVRGEVGALGFTPGDVHFGSLACLASSISQTSTVGFEDAARPAPGEAFFYLVEYDDGMPSGFGTESAVRETVSPKGGVCP